MAELNISLNQLKNTRDALKKMAILNLGICSTCQYCKLNVPYDGNITYVSVYNYELYTDALCEKLIEPCSEIRFSLAQCDYYKMITSNPIPYYRKSIKIKVGIYHFILNVIKAIIYSFKINNFDSLNTALKGKEYESKTKNSKRS